MRSDESRDQGDWRCRWGLLVAPWFGRKPPPPPLQTVCPHHLLHHPHSQALLEATELATVSSSLVHRAVFVCQADVLSVLLHCPLKESLAALAGADAIVLAGSIVPAHGTGEAQRGGLEVEVSEIGLRGHLCACRPFGEHHWSLLPTMGH